MNLSQIPAIVANIDRRAVAWMLTLAMSGNIWLVLWVKDLHTEIRELHRCRITDRDTIQMLSYKVIRQQEEIIKLQDADLRHKDEEIKNLLLLLNNNKP